jgi:hypothetical protein
LSQFEPSIDPAWAATSSLEFESRVRQIFSPHLPTCAAAAASLVRVIYNAESLLPGFILRRAGERTDLLKIFLRSCPWIPEIGAGYLTHLMMCL